ncbi:hypothetical protein [Azotobacter chroococcum]|nr:hypothetical protein [Azotobacter chroococcum]
MRREDDYQQSQVFDRRRVPSARTSRRESVLAAPGSAHLRGLAEQIQPLDEAVPCCGALATELQLVQDFSAVSAEQPVPTGQHHNHGDNMNNNGADVAVYVQKYKGFDMAVEPYRSELGRKWIIRASVRRDKEVFTSRKTDVDYCCCGLDAAREAGFQHCRALIDRLARH